jgi:hypothetical protein
MFHAFSWHVEQKAAGYHGALQRIPAMIMRHKADEAQRRAEGVA